MTSLRDALTAQPDDDFDLPAVVRPRPAARPRRTSAKPPRKIGAVERLTSLTLRHPRRIVTALLLAGCGGAIAWNALVLQRAHHPAPLFSGQRAAAPAPAPTDAPARPLPPLRPENEFPDAQASTAVQPQPMAQAPASPVTAPAAPAPKPLSRSAIADLIRRNGEKSNEAEPAAPAPAKAVPAPAVAPSPSRAPTVRDPIAEIIRMGGPVPTPPANVGRADAGDLVLSGQRALAKLGYGVKVDGMMGPGTHQAIERFEQDRHLPVTGEFNGRTVRELSTLSGITVQ